MSQVYDTGEAAKAEKRTAAIRGEYCARCGSVSGPLHPPLLPGYFVHPGECPAQNRYREWVVTGEDLLNRLYDSEDADNEPLTSAINYIEGTIGAMRNHG